MSRTGSSTPEIEGKVDRSYRSWMVYLTYTSAIQRYSASLSWQYSRDTGVSELPIFQVTLITGDREVPLFTVQ